MQKENGIDGQPEGGVDEQMKGIVSIDIAAGQKMLGRRRLVSQQSASGLRRFLSTSLNRGSNFPFEHRPHEAMRSRFWRGYSDKQ
jgi:hypothetical protein